MVTGTQPSLDTMQPRQLVCALLVAALAAAVHAQAVGTAGDLLSSVYRGCVEHGDFGCVKPRLLAFLSASLAQDKLRISRDLAIVRRLDGDSTNAQDQTAQQEPLPLDSASLESAEGRRLVLERVDDFLSTHELRVRVPKELADAPAAFVPAFLLDNLPEEIRVPLADEREEGRRRGGMLRKVVIPFLLGLKFKVSALMPLALALIALKTWKALTLGLLSIVLSAAMVIFKITKPKITNYEIVHLPRPAAVIEHPVAHYDAHPHAAYARSMAAHPIAYRAHYRPQQQPQL